MEKLYVVTEFETRELKKGEFEETEWYVNVNGNKIYKYQFDEYLLLGNNIGVVTTDKAKSEYWKEKLVKFFKTYREVMKKWDIEI